MMNSKFALAIVACLIATPAFADWRMDRFDLNGDNLISKEELKAAQCTVNDGIWSHADKNKDGFLNVKEARKASLLIFRNNCPKMV